MTQPRAFDPLQLSLPAGENAEDGGWEFSWRGVIGSGSLPFLQFVFCAALRNQHTTPTGIFPKNTIIFPRNYIYWKYIHMFLNFYILGGKFIFLGIYIYILKYFL